MPGPATSGAEVVSARRVPRPSTHLHPDLAAKLLDVARAQPGGWVARGRWLAITRFDEPWCTALVRLDGVPTEAVHDAAEFAAYIRRLHSLLLASYASRDLALPPWRAWAAIARRWPPVSRHAPPPPRPVHVLQPIPDVLTARSRPLRIPSRR